MLFLICTNLSNDKLCACAVICVRSSIFFSLSSHIPSINLANYFIAFVRFKLNVLFLLLKVDKKSDRGAVAVVKWSACSPSTPTIRVRIPLTPTVFLYKLCLKRTKINKKEAGVGPFFLKDNWNMDLFSWRIEYINGMVTVHVLHQIFWYVMNTTAYNTWADIVVHLHLTTKELYLIELGNLDFANTESHLKKRRKIYSMWVKNSSLTLPP